MYLYIISKLKKHETGEKRLKKKVKTENSPARDMSPERMFPGFTRGKG